MIETASPSAIETAKNWAVSGFLALSLGASALGAGTEVQHEGITVYGNAPPLDLEAMGKVKIAPGEGEIALTIDDGPRPWTLATLDMLDEYNVKATFFVVGFRAAAYPEMLREIVRRGHNVASHTYYHPRMTGLSNAGVLREIQRTDQIIYEITGKLPTCFRYPWGIGNTRTDRIVRGQGLERIDWTQDSQDYVERSSLVIKNSFHWGEKDIVLMHDLDYIYDDGVLRDIVARLREKGLRFTKLCEMYTPPPKLPIS